MGDGRAIMPDGRAIMPDGRAITLDGRCFMPDGRTFVRDDRIFMRDGRTFNSTVLFCAVTFLRKIHCPKAFRRHTYLACGWIASTAHVSYPVSGPSQCPLNHHAAPCRQTARPGRLIAHQRPKAMGQECRLFTPPTQKPEEPELRGKEMKAHRKRQPWTKGDA